KMTPFMRPSLRLFDQEGRGFRSFRLLDHFRQTRLDSAVSRPFEVPPVVIPPADQGVLGGPQPAKGPIFTTFHPQRPASNRALTSRNELNTALMPYSIIDVLRYLQTIRRNSN